MERSYSQLNAEELLLECANDGSSQAWEEFLGRFHSVVVSVALRTIRRYTTASADLCDDLTQEVYLKLSARDCRMLRAFVPRHPGSAYGFIKVVTANVVHDYFREQRHFRQQETLADSIGAASDIQRRLLERDVDDLLCRYAGERERQIFWLYYRQGLTAQEIAALRDFGLSVKGVESLLMRMRSLMRTHLACGAAGGGVARRRCRMGQASRGRVAARHLGG